MALFPKYCLFLYRRFPEYKMSARTSVMIQGDNLEALLTRAGRIMDKKQSPWSGFSFTTTQPGFATLATFYIV